jgi:fumarate reductase subunit C
MSKCYHRPQRWYWFVQKRTYLLFMVRELTAVPIGAYLIFLLILLARLGAGEEAFVVWIKFLSSPMAKVLHSVALIAALWHSITWFNLTPKAMPIFLGEKRVADPLVAFALGYLPWIIVTCLILWSMWP